MLPSGVIVETKPHFLRRPIYRGPWALSSASWQLFTLHALNSATDTTVLTTASLITSRQLSFLNVYSCIHSSIHSSSRKKTLRMTMMTVFLKFSLQHFFFLKIRPIYRGWGLAILFLSKRPHLHKILEAGERAETHTDALNFYCVRVCVQNRTWV